ncbi:hypothetical protein PIB30_073115 [Stylosanthes scabra]|uniref:Uncharacterized protein n=1 Tax=Stylosanthes scabra TaxID=79078 RepID=A0ABU6YPM7_9FABA|nr:hypothetical protein [Stylosanthes scabra]
MELVACIFQPHDLIHAVDKTTQVSFKMKLEKIYLRDFIVGSVARNGPAQICLTTGSALTFVDGYTMELPGVKIAKRSSFHRCSGSQQNLQQLDIHHSCDSSNAIATLTSAAWKVDHFAMIFVCEAVDLVRIGVCRGGRLAWIVQVIVDDFVEVQLEEQHLHELEEDHSVHLELC